MWPWFWKWKTLALPIWRVELITNKIKQNYLKQRDLAPLREHTHVLIGLLCVRDFFFTQHFAIPTIGRCFDNLTRSYRQRKDDLRLKWRPSTKTTPYSFRTIDFTPWAEININTSPFKCQCQSMNAVFLGPTLQSSRRLHIKTKKELTELPFSMLFLCRWLFGWTLPRLQKRLASYW